AWTITLGDEAPAEIVQAASAALSNGKQKEIEMDFAGRAYELTFFPVSQADYVNVYFNDITDRKNAADFVRYNERRLNQLLSILPACIYTCDKDGRLTFYNEAAAKLWGRAPEIGKDLWCGSYRTYRPDGSPLPLDQRPVAITLREGRPVHGVEIVI